MRTGRRLLLAGYSDLPCWCVLLARGCSDADHAQDRDADRHCLEDGYHCNTHAPAIGEGDRYGHGGCKPDWAYGDPSANLAGSPDANILLRAAGRGDR